MTTNEIVGRLKAGGLDASSTNRGAAVYVTEARSGRAEPGWFGFRIICDSEATERRVRAILSRWYDIDASGNVWRLRSKNRVPLMAIKRGGVPPTPPTIDKTWLYFTMPEGGTVTLTKNGSPTAVTLEYSLDNGTTWTEWTENGNVRTLTLTAGETMHVRNTSPTSTRFSTSNVNYYKFSFNADTYAGGNIMSLLCSNPSLAIMDNYCFMQLFKDCLNLITPADIAATSIAMFSCYYMYYGCTSLIAACDMSAVTSIGQSGCNSMYYGCTSLNYVKIGNPDISASDCLYRWLYNVSATGDFYCSSSLTIPTGVSGIPTGWTRHDI